MHTTLTRRLILPTLVLFFSLAVYPHGELSEVHGQSPSAAAAPQVIPKPKVMTPTIAVFRFAKDVRIRLADPRSADDRFAAEDFIADARETANLNLRIGDAARSILVGRVDLPRVSAAIQNSGLTVPANLGDEGYLLAVTDQQIIVAGKTAAGTFYGLQTLKQLIRGEGPDAFVPGVQITDWPEMRWRGVSDDISRGPVPTVEYIKRQLRTFAAYKLNMHSFYMEHTFESAAHPLIGPKGGSLSPDEIRELSTYARRYHIELVPEQQTFGHLHKALKFEKYNELAEVPYGDVLSPQQEGSYKLVADWYRELDPLFPGKFFHIGADETFELGEGQSREVARTQGVGAVYFAHLNRVREVLKPYNRRLMFWGDIALNHPELISNVPKDMIVMNWSYGPRDSFEDRIKPFQDAGLDQFVCPGAGNWNQIFPNIDSASKNIVNFVRDGQTAKVMGMMNTTWDDDGEGLFEMTWHGIVLGAAASWQNGSADIGEFDRNFDWAFFRNDGNQFVQALRALGRVNVLLGINQSDEHFWRDPFTDSFQMQSRALREKVKQMRLSVEAADESLLRHESSARRNRSMIGPMRFAAQRFDHLGRRMQVVDKFSQEYWDAYLNLGDRRKVGRLRNYWGNIYNWLREMAEELTELRESYRRQWLAENRPYWLDSVLARYDRAIIGWLNKSKALEEAVRVYNTSSVLPNPQEFGLGPRPQTSPTPAR